MTTLALREAGRTYPGAVPVEALRPATLTIRQGDFVAIEGPSGAGKSTLLNVLALLDAPTTGRYEIDGVPTAGLSDADAARLRCRTFGFIFQSFHLLPRRSALENVMLGTAYHGLDLTTSRERARQALDFVGLSARAQLPAGQLSGGERQRVAIARAICAHAPVLVADEPTGNLDSASSAAVMDLLAGLAERGTTVIVVTHDPAVAARARRRIRVVDGVVTEASQTSHSPDAPSAEPTADKVAVPPDASAGAGSQARPAARASGTQDEPGYRSGGEMYDVSAARAGVDDGASSRLRARVLAHDVAQALVTDPGRAARLVAVVIIAVTLALTVLSLSHTASYQVSDLFDAQRNRRVAVGIQPPAGGDDPAEQAVTPARVAARANPDGLARVAAIPGVQEAMAVSHHSKAAVTTDPALPAADIDLFGIAPATDLTELLHVTQAVSDQPWQLGEGQALVGSAAAGAIGLGPVAASPTIWVGGTPYEVVGLLVDGGLRSDLTGGVLLSQEQASALQDAGEASLEIRVQPGAAQQVAEDAAVAWLPFDADSTVTSAPPDPTSMREVLESDLRAVLLTLTGVAVLAGIAVLSNAMDNAVQVRTGELALRRAIGARRVHLRVLIAGEAALIGLAGGAVGAVASVLVVLGVTIVQHWRPVVDPLSLPLGIAVGALAGLLAAVLASRKAGRIQPAAALR